MLRLELTVVCIVSYIYRCTTVEGLFNSSPNASESTTQQDPGNSFEDGSTFGDPYWLRVGVIIFIVVLVVPLAVSLTVGLYKYRKYANKHGLYKKKARIYSETARDGPTNFEMFTVQNNSDQQPSPNIE